MCWCASIHKSCKGFFVIEECKVCLQACVRATIKVHLTKMRHELSFNLCLLYDFTLAQQMSKESS